MKPLIIILATIWGILWASYLQFTENGNYLAVRRTWITVVIGVGVDMLIALMIIPLEYWLWTMIIISTSSLGIIARSLYNEYHEDRTFIEELKNGH